ncbi:MAG: GST-like protein [Myxococcota bacterium]|jgi:GST-like protein
MLVEQRWPIADRSKIQLFSMPTPNGVKIGVALEELGLPYEAHRVDITNGEQLTSEFVSISPNGKIPVIIDPDAFDTPTAIMESGAILIHLADKAGKLIPQDPKGRMECLQWLFFQVGHIGPMFGQFGHFLKFASDKCDHPYPLERYLNESRRLLGVLDRRLAGRAWLAGNMYTIADIAIFPWISGLLDFYRAGDLLGFEGFSHVAEWYGRCIARPASVRGAKVASA